MNFSIAFDPDFFGSSGTIYLSVTKGGTTKTASVALGTVSLANCLVSMGSYTYPVFEVVNYWPSPQVLCSINYREFMPYRGTGNISSTFNISNYSGGLPGYIPYVYANNKTMVYGSSSSLSNSFQYYIPPGGRPLYGIYCIMKAMSGGSCIHARSTHLATDSPTSFPPFGGQEIDLKTADRSGYYPYEIALRPALNTGSAWREQVTYTVLNIGDVGVTYEDYFNAPVMPSGVTIFCFGESSTISNFNFKMATNGASASQWRIGTIPMKSLQTYSLEATDSSGVGPLIVW
jgi:hypothetical protein